MPSALAAILVIVVAVLNRDRGVSYMFLAFLVLVVIMDLAIRRTTLGPLGPRRRRQRRGGPPRRHQRQADLPVGVRRCARPSPRSAGSSRPSRLASANQSSGGGDTNLNAIAAAVIGGTSLFGGRGSAYSALLGILVIQSISNGLALLAVESNVKFMVTGAVLLLAVIIDSLSRRSRAAHGRA